MIEVVRERTVDAPPGAVWALVEDVERLPEWLTLAERAEFLGGVGRGRRQRMYGRWGKKRFEADEVVTEYEPERLLAWRHEAERFEGKAPPRFARETELAIRLAASGNGTLVRLESRQEPVNRLRGVAIRLVGSRQVARSFERSLERLAEAVSPARGSDTQPEATRGESSRSPA